MNAKIMIVGIGGQGVLFATKLLGEAAMALGLPVIGSETHGMSQRGGSVASHIKIGDYRGPMIRKGDAEILIGFDPRELVRALPFLANGGLCFGAMPGHDDLPESVRGIMQNMKIRSYLFDARSIACSLGDANLTNVVVMGRAAAIPEFPFRLELLTQILTRIAPPKRRDSNLLALRTGYELSLRP